MPCVSIRAELKLIYQHGDRVAPELTAKPETLGAAHLAPQRARGWPAPRLEGWSLWTLAGAGHSLGRPEGWVGEGR